MSEDRVQYITSGTLDGSQGEALYSRLMSTLRDLRQGSAPPSQWSGILKGLTQKGIKLSEVEDSEVLSFLDAANPQTKITREELLSEIQRRMPRIKRVDLGKPLYSGYRNMTEGTYTERLYILASEAMAADDRIEELLYRIEDLGFDPSPLLRDPGLVDRLEKELFDLKFIRPRMWDFRAHHFNRMSDKHGKNLMAHARTTQIGDLFFIDEIQSDWAQQGRRHNWGPAYPKAPFVTNTEQWAGLVTRDLMHEAATSGASRVAWINWDMRNGWDSETNQGSVDDDTFYRSIIPKIVNKAIEKAGGKVVKMQVDTKHGLKEVLGFAMTDSVREALTKAQPMYSREQLLPANYPLDDPQRQAERAMIVQECRQMLGSAHTIRFVNRLYDIASGNEVAGRYINRGIEISLKAKNMTRATRHEAWHFAHENLLLTHERRQMRLSFAEGTHLNDLTRKTLLEQGQYQAAAQCADHQECAAHAFALWSEGQLNLGESKEGGIFSRVLQALDKMADWLEDKVFGVKVASPEDLFAAMRSGALAARARLAAMHEDESHESEHSASVHSPMC